MIKSQRQKKNLMFDLLTVKDYELTCKSYF